MWLTEASGFAYVYTSDSVRVMFSQVCAYHCPLKYFSINSSRHAYNGEVKHKYISVMSFELCFDMYIMTNCVELLRRAKFDMINTSRCFIYIYIFISKFF